MQTYSDPRLLDVHGAIKSLPSLPLAKATAPKLAVELAVAPETLCEPVESGDTVGKMGGESPVPEILGEAIASCIEEAACVNPSAERQIGIEPTTGALGSVEHCAETPENTEDSESAANACTPACTSDPELQQVVAAWPSLPAAIRRAILALIG